MGWLSDFFSGGTQKQNSATNSAANKQQTNATQAIETNNTGTGIHRQTSTNQQNDALSSQNEVAGTSSQFNTQNLDAASIAQLQGALSKFGAAIDPQIAGALAQGNLTAGTIAAQNFGNFADNTTARAGNNIGAVVAEARRQGEIGLGQQLQALAGGAGSTANTLVQQLGAEGKINLETSLAAQQGSLMLQADQQEAQNRAAAVNAMLQAAQGANQNLATGSSTLAEIGGTLKGATQSGTAAQNTLTQRQTHNYGQTIGTVNDVSSANQYSTTNRAALEAIDALIAESTNGTANSKAGLTLGTVLGWLPS